MKADIHHEDSRNELVIISLYLKSRTIKVSSLYCPPSVNSLACQFNILDNVKNISHLVIGDDFNARSPLWSQRTATDIRSKELEDFLASKNLVVSNNPNKST